MQIYHSRELQCLTLFEIGSEALLFQKTTKELFLLNESATEIWKMYSFGNTEREIAQALMARYQSAAASSIEFDVDSLMADWRALDGRRIEQDGDLGELTSSRQHQIAQGKYLTSQLQLLDLNFRISSNDKQAVIFAEKFFEHLRCFEADHDATRDFLLTKSDLDWELTSDSGESVQALGHALAPLLHGEILLQAHLQTPSLAALHSAAISKGNSCVLIPGLSGSGKSTLAAALSLSGYDYCTDELSVLTADLKLRPCPVNIGLKEGSWGALDEFSAQVDLLDTWTRDDGQRVRYLPPSNSQGHDSLKEIVAIVFPRYMHAAPCCLEPLSPANALQALTVAGYDTAVVDENWIVQMISLLTSIPCFELQYSDMPEAIKHFRSWL